MAFADFSLELAISRFELTLPPRGPVRSCPDAGNPAGPPHGARPLGTSGTGSEHREGTIGTDHRAHPDGSDASGGPWDGGVLGHIAGRGSRARPVRPMRFLARPSVRSLPPRITVAGGRRGQERGHPGEPGTMRCGDGGRASPESSARATRSRWFTARSPPAPNGSSCSSKAMPSPSTCASGSSMTRGGSSVTSPRSSWPVMAGPDSRRVICRRTGRSGPTHRPQAAIPS